MLNRIVICMFALCLCGCRQNRLNVERMPTPDYPISARFENIQGTVKVHVSIGTDGKVIYASGTGGADVLVKAAQENAQAWLFGPFPSVGEFPIEHDIQFEYRLDGKPKYVASPPVIRTHLPDRIEISAVPLTSDYPPVVKSNQASKK